MMDYRALTPKEIQALTANHCRAQNWADLQVAEDFNPGHYHQVTFSGKVYLGSTGDAIVLPGGRSVNAGIHHATIHNCTIGNQVYINRVQTVLGNYCIHDHVVIENVGSLLVTTESSFGNGTRVKVTNEGGGREVPIYDKLSAQTAYFISVYRHRPQLVQRLEKMIESHTDSVISDMGVIGEHAVIRDCSTIRNVNIGDYAKIEGAILLKNGSINSESNAPAQIGHGVIAKNFITSQGSLLTDSAVVENLFLGQACTIGSQFSATDLLMFSNSKALNGEACSAFMGPFSITDHKSTLLIAGMVSYWNGGSGTNQSNHLYKLGPTHQGRMDRGCKTASNAYIMWPARIGAFSLVMGKVITHPDTSDMPYSYLIGNPDGVTRLVPAANLKSIGLYRDNNKWQARDQRRAGVKLDRVRSDVYNPYTMDKIMRGRNTLQALADNPVPESGKIAWNGCFIHHKDLERGMELYDRSIINFLGDILFSTIHTSNNDFTSWQSSLKPGAAGAIAAGEWLDMAGMLAPRQAMENVMQDIESGAISGLSQLRPIICGIHFNYQAFLITWVTARLEAITGVHPANWTVDNLKAFSTDYLQAIDFWQAQLLNDAAKEFDPIMMTGYGPDDDKPTQLADFTAVHGAKVNNAYLKELQQEFKSKRNLVKAIVANLPQ